METCRNGGHRITGPGDRRSNGHCARCASNNERRYRTRREERIRQQAQDDVIARMEDLGFRIDPKTFAATPIKGGE